MKIQGGFSQAYVLARSNNSSNTNGGVAYSNANNSSSNTNSNNGSRLTIRKEDLNAALGLGRVPYLPAGK